MKKWIALFVSFALLPGCATAQTATHWHTATPAELSAALPARAPVAKERIESEMRTASGIINERGQLVAAVLLITAGYAAEGRFSHYLLTQQPIRIGNIDLSPGAYVIGWSRTADGLLVHVYDAATVTDRGTILARPLAQPVRIESFRIWPPGDRSYIQIGRYKLPYSISK